ncbi:MAG: ABC transporter ATP-binding protein [Paracoccaceae bacterium]
MVSTLRLVLASLDRGRRRRFVVLLGLMLATGVAELVGVATVLPFLTVLADPEAIHDRALLGRLYEVFGFEQPFVFLQWLGAGIFVTVMLSIAFRAGTHYAMTRFIRGTATDLGRALLASYLARPYEWFLQRHSADLGKTVLREANDVVLGSIAPALRIVANLIVLALLTGFLLAVEPVGTLAMAAFLGAAFGLFYRRLQPFLETIGQDRRVANRERHQATAEAMGAIKEVKLHGLEETYLDRYAAPSRRLERHHAALALAGELPRYALEALIVGAMLLFTLWLLASRDGRLDEALPVLGAFGFAAVRLMPLMQTLFADVAKMRFGLPALIGIHDDLASAPTPRASDDRRVRLGRALELDAVSFRYEGADRAALQDVSLTIRAGESVGVAGPTGSGKTTLMDILLGLVEPQRGRLVVDGTAIDSATMRAWQRGIGYVPQSIYLFDDTIAANIAFGRKPGGIDPDAIERAARLANLHDFVEGLPMGYETAVGEAGVRLSGGQRQRIGIARALYRDPDVVVFDEATSALDPVTERAVIDAIRALSGRKTIFIVTHRLSTVAHCDRILLLNAGRLEAEGDHEGLSSRSPTFRSMLAATG